MGLTNKQAAFLSEYLIDFNATQAAIRAGYSSRSATQIGQRLLLKDDISAEIKRFLAEKTMKSEEILQELADIARGDMGDFLDISSMTWQVDLAKAKELGLTKLIKKVKQRTNITQRKDGDEEENTQIEIELADKLRALELLAKMSGMLSDKTEITGKNGGPVTVKVVWEDAAGHTNSA